MSSQPGAKPDTVSSNKRVGSSSLRKYSEEETIFTTQKREKKRKKKFYKPVWMNSMISFKLQLELPQEIGEKVRKKNTNKWIKAEII